MFIVYTASLTLNLTLHFFFYRCHIYRDECAFTRRRLELAEDSHSGIDMSVFDDVETMYEEAPPTNRLHRQLSVNQAECTAEIATVTAQINCAIPLVSADCQDVLLGHRDYTCFNTDDTCENLTFNLWNTDTQTVSVTGFSNGSTISKAAFDFSIEADAVSCVDKVEFLLTGPNGYAYARVEEVSKYLLFGDDGVHVTGSTLDKGAYTLIVRPKRQSKFPEQTLTFTVVD